MKIKNIFFFTIFIFCIFSIFIIAVHQKLIFQNAREKLEQHGQVISNAMWRYEAQDPVAYLHLAAELNQYRHVLVLDEGNKEFLSISGPLPRGMDPFFIRLGLIPVKPINAKVFYNGNLIGEIRVEWYNKAIYTYLYLGFCMILIFSLQWFFLKLAAAKKTLEIRVRQRTAELNELRKYLSSIINSMPSVLIGVDEKNRVTHWNNRAEKKTGIPSEDAHGQHLSKVFPAMASELGKITHSIQNHQIRQERKKPRQTGTGTSYDEVTIFPLTGDSQKGAVIRIDDVTAKVRMEEMMIQNEKMLSVGGLAAGMAHEINNPLAGMMQTAEVMKNRLNKDSAIEANQRAARKAGTSMVAVNEFMEARGIHRMISTITDSGRRVAAIVDNMLSFARQSGEGKMPLNLCRLMDKTLELATTDYDLKKQYDFKLIPIKKDYPPHMPDVFCEGSKIQQVLLNILRNGAHAMQQAGTSRPCFTIRISFDSQRQTACIEIQDNGPGMDGDTRKRVFEPFFTTKSTGEGTGLGLSVSYFIITENHKGSLAVDSQPGEGANFIIRLPVSGKMDRACP